MVLFPGSRISLHIFEERYKKMITLCLESQLAFGVNLIENKEINLVGCTAVVEEVTAKYPNGEMRINVIGVRKYELETFKASDDGYYLGNIIYRSEAYLDYDAELMVKTVDMYNELVEIVYKGQVNQIELSDTKWKQGDISLACWMAQKAGLSLEERQALLEMDTEQERLEYMHKYFENVFPKMNEVNRLSEIIKGDGYIQ